MFFFTHTQIFPVKFTCGQRCGLHITAITAIPDAVRIGFTFNFGKSFLVNVRGIADIILTSLG